MGDATGGARDEDIDVPSLREVLADHPITLALAHGSRVRGEAFSWSDLDVAVRLEPDVEGRERGRVLDRLAAELEDVSEAGSVDVADVDAMGPHHAYEAARTGVLLLGDEAEAADLEARALLRKLDFEPVRQAWREALDERIEEGRYGRA